MGTGGPSRWAALQSPGKEACRHAQGAKGPADWSTWEGLMALVWTLLLPLGDGGTRQGLSRRAAVLACAWMD